MHWSCGNIHEINLVVQSWDSLTYIRFHVISLYFGRILWRNVAVADTEESLRYSWQQTHGCIDFKSKCIEVNEIITCVNLLLVQLACRGSWSSC